MDFINNYIEMMGDTEFAIYVAAFVFGLILLIGLIAKLNQAKASVPSLAPPKAEEPKKKAVEPAPKKVEAPAAVVPAPVPSLEGAMMWEGDDGKKKKSKATPPPLPAKAVPQISPLPVAKKAESPAVTPPEEKTVILPPKAVEIPVKPAAVEAAVTPAKAVSPAPPVEAPAPSPEKSFIDLQMYEVLVRRISGIEADMKREPLFLDPLMKRMGQTEKRVEELASKPGGDGVAKRPSDDGELNELKEKVARLQKLLEQLSEGPFGPAGPSGPAAS